MAKKENTITKGGIETAVEGFMGNITTSAPFTATYGDHKTPGSQMAPTTAAGRGDKGSGMRSHIFKDVNFRLGGKK